MVGLGSSWPKDRVYRWFSKIINSIKPIKLLLIEQFCVQRQNYIIMLVGAHLSCLFKWLAIQVLLLKRLIKDIHIWAAYIMRLAKSSSGAAFGVVNIAGITSKLLARALCVAVLFTETAVVRVDTSWWTGVSGRDNCLNQLCGVNFNVPRRRICLQKQLWFA